MLNILFVAAGCFWAILFHSGFGGGFVFITAVLYLLRGRKGISYGLGALVSLIYATAPLGFVPVAMCCGERRDMGRVKYAYYAFYPVMLALFALWVRPNLERSIYRDRRAAQYGVGGRFFVKHPPKIFS